MIELSQHEYYKPKDGCSCGAEDALFDFVPDTIFGLDIRPVCCRHDDRYERGGTEYDRRVADREFLSNLLTIINSNNRWYYPTMWARYRAMTYYNAVVECGSSSFNYKDVR